MKRRSRRAKYSIREEEGDPVLLDADIEEWLKIYEIQEEIAEANKPPSKRWKRYSQSKVKRIHREIEECREELNEEE